jgi:hypothetical protein
MLWENVRKIFMNFSNFTVFALLGAVCGQASRGLQRYGGV